MLGGFGQSRLKNVSWFFAFILLTPLCYSLPNSFFSSSATFPSWTLATPAVFLHLGPSLAIAHLFFLVPLYLNPLQLFLSIFGVVLHFLFFVPLKLSKFFCLSLMSVCFSTWPYNLSRRDFTSSIISAPRNTGWRTKCHTIDCTHNTFLLLQKHLISVTELIFIGWEIVPNESL